MKWKLKEQYKVSMKQRVGSLKEQRQLLILRKPKLIKLDTKR
jgi:hypothetical protein